MRTTSSDADRSRALALVAICAGFFMVILDTTIVNAALPAMGHDLGGGVSSLQWVVNGYTLVFAALLLSGGTLGDRLGSRGVFAAGVAIFTLASAACAVAPGAATLVLARLVQGLGAALSVPTSLALLRAVTPDPAARARAIGIWGGAGGIAAASGPVLGGLLTGTVGWRSVFAVNVPVGVLCLRLTARYAPAPRPEQRRRLDPAAQVLALLTLATLSFGLIESGVRGWADPLVLGALGAVPPGVAAFVAVELRAPDPMLPLSMFSRGVLRTGTMIGMLINLGFYGQLFVVNLYLQQLRGLSPLQAGLALLPEAGMVSVGAVLSGRLTGRAGPRPAMLTGLTLGGTGMLALAAASGAHTAYALLVLPLAATGFGMAFTMPAVTTAVVEAAPEGRAALASGLINAARQSGGLIGVALLGSLVGNAHQHRGLPLGGLHAALVLAATAFLGGALLTFLTRMPGPTGSATFLRRLTSTRVGIPGRHASH